jgi:malic enzyme
MQANNAYIFLDFGLGLVMTGVIRVHDEYSFIIRAAEALGNQMTEESYKKDLTYPLPLISKTFLPRHMN